MAKKFNFRLEPILKLKSHNVQIALDSLNQAVRIRSEKEESIKEHTEYRNTLIDSKSEHKKASDFVALYHHRDYIDNEIERLKLEKTRILEIENIRRKKLTNAMKEEKVLEKLKEKKIFNHKEDVRKEEGKFLDEIAINAHYKPVFK